MLKSLAATFTEKVNYRISPILFILLAIFAFFVPNNSRTQCWAPATFTDAMVNYAEKYCGSTTSYFPGSNDGELQAMTRSKSLASYNWVPAILLLQAIFSFLPYFIWKALLSIQNGLDLEGLSSMAHEAVETPEPIRKKHFVDSLAAIFHYHLVTKKASLIVTLCYLLVLALCVINSIVQLSLLDNLFFGQRFYGLSVLSFVLKGQEWPSAKAFPRVILCDFQVRTLGNVHHHTLQCVLPMNDVFEKIFVMIWLWIAFCLILNTCALIYWTVVSLFSFMRVKFVGRHLVGTHVAQDAANNDFLWNFAANFMGIDGIFCLRLFGDTFGQFLVGEIIRELLKKYIQHHQRPYMTLDPINRSFNEFGIQKTADSYKTYKVNSNEIPKLKDEINGDSMKNGPYSLLSPSVYPTAPQQEDS